MDVPELALEARTAEKATSEATAAKQIRAMTEGRAPLAKGAWTSFQGPRAAPCNGWAPGPLRFAWSLWRLLVVLWLDEFR